MAYATATDLAAWTGDPAPADAARLLERAALEVDYALIGAVYATDVNGMPTDAVVIAALRDASTAQVEWWLVTQDEVGQNDLDHSVAATDQGVTKQRAPGRRPRLCPRAAEILMLARSSSIGTLTTPLLPVKAIV